MLFFKLQELRIIAGLRYEQTELAYRARELILDENGEYFSTEIRTDDNSYSNWFPGVHGRYDLGNFSFVGSWSNTIERPEFERVVPFRQVNRESESIETGNPGLKPTLFTNYDFSVDYNFNEDDLVSVEFFYQTVEDIVYREVTLVPDGIYSGYELETDQNGPSGKIYGLRLIWSQGLGKWLEFAEGLFLGVKYSYQVSETIYPDRPGVTLPMPDRPENELEFSLSYERFGFFAQLDVEYQQSNLEEINDEAPWRDKYRATRTSLNFSSSYEVTDGIRLLFEISNLTNELDDEGYFGDELLLIEYKYAPRMFKFGIKFDL